MRKNRLDNKINIFLDWQRQIKIQMFFKSKLSLVSLFCFMLWENVSEAELKRALDLAAIGGLRELDVIKALVGRIKDINSV